MLGVVADCNWSDADITRAVLPNLPAKTSSLSSQMDWFSTLRTRSGVVVNDTLVYVTGGLAAAKIENTYTSKHSLGHRSNENTFSKTRWGWTGGAGAEFALADGWSANAEVLYMQFRKKPTHSAVRHPIATDQLRKQQFRLGRARRPELSLGRRRQGPGGREILTRAQR